MFVCVLFVITITIATAGRTVSIFYSSFGNFLCYCIIIKIYSSEYVEKCLVRGWEKMHFRLFYRYHFRNYPYNTRNEILCNDNFIIILKLNIILYENVLKYVLC
jgi:hypothetical protein